MYKEFYEKNLPSEVKRAGFCVCKVGSKVPYNPKTRRRCDPTDRSHFLSFEEVMEFLPKPDYDVLGIQVGSGGVCAIDIDDCVDEDGNISSMAVEIINLIGSYTEISPSMTGVRILFTSPAEHDYTIHYSKNSQFNVETYPLNNNGRMVRLTGVPLTEHPYREVPTETYLEFCERWMRRANSLPNLSIQIDWEVKEVTPQRLKELVDEIKAVPSLRSIWGGNWFRPGKTDSEIDFALVVGILKITNQFSEIKAAFESGRWFRLKLKKRDEHGTLKWKNKWEYRQNDYLKVMLRDATNPKWRNPNA